MAGSITADSVKQEEYLKAVKEAKHILLELFNSDGWKHVSGDTLENGIISYRNVKQFGRNLFRLQCQVNLPARDLWDHMARTNNESPKWNKSVVSVVTLQQINENTVVGHSKAAEALGGLISARDFVSLRHWSEITPTRYLMFGISCEHPAMPEQKKFVRGENGPGGLLYEVCPEDSTKCNLTWIVNTDPKGWIPQAAVDKAMKGLLEDYCKALNNFYKDGIPL